MHNMKKIYFSLITLLAAGALSATAQQLPNNGFEAWSTSESTPWTNGKGNKTIGYNPSNWCISHVMGVSTGFFAGSGKKAMGEKVTPGYNSSVAATKVYNAETGALGITRNVPGYVTLGTTWSTAEGTNTKTHDGGTWGGISFEYRPDAIEFMYKREYADASATTEPFSFIAYLWKGSWTQALVPVTITSGGSIKDADKCTMTNRDRNILSYSTTVGGTVSQSSDAELIGKIIVTQAGVKSEWTHAQFEMEYATSSTPTMFNIIFSANDYFDASSTPVIGNSLTIDDVKLLYYSRLASISVNGTPVTGFSSDTYSYTIDSEMPEESAFAFTCLGNSGSGKATLSLDKDNAKATITVTNNNAGGTDVDGQTSHVYTIQFNKTTAPIVEPEGTKYKGTLNIVIAATNLNITQPDSVYIKDNGDGTCTFLLSNFTLTLDESTGPANFGDIKVENVNMTKNADGTISYSGEVKGMQLANGEINADVTVTGTETADGKLTMSIPVIWTDADMTIDVTFNGEKDATSGITDVPVDNSNAPVEYFNIQGMRINADNLTPGIYIRRQGTDVRKVLVK